MAAVGSSAHRRQHRQAGGLIVPLGTSFYARNVAPALADFDIPFGDSEQFGDDDGLLISFTSKDKRPASDAIANLQFVKFIFRHSDSQRDATGVL